MNELKKEINQLNIEKSKKIAILQGLRIAEIFEIWKTERYGFLDNAEAEIVKIFTN